MSDIEMEGTVTGYGKSYRFVYKSGRLFLLRKSNQGPGWVQIASRMAMKHRDEVEKQVTDIRAYLDK